jgi:DNA-binding NtrC family response regulator
MPRNTLSDVLIVHAHDQMRQLLHLALSEAGYHVVAAASYDAVLHHLRTASKPVVVVSGNWATDYEAEQEFFGQLAADATLARRHRYVLLCTIPEYLPDDLDALLCSLGVFMLAMPLRLHELLATVACVARRTPLEDEPAG